MEILKQQTFQFGGGRSTCSPEDSLANRLALQETEKEPTMSATYGQKCCEQFKRFGHVGLWAKMFVDLLVGQTEWYSKRCALTWKMQGMKCNRFLFQLVPSAHHTAGIEFGLLPTPVNPMMLPTPTAIDKGTGRMNRSLSKNAADRPTLALIAKIGLLPTPTVNDATNNSLPKSQANRKSGITGMIIRDGGSNSRLNPQYVEEMMGFPEGWTALPFQHGAENQLRHTETQ